MPAPGDTAAVAALYTASNPTEAKSPYHAFAHCPPTELFTKPTQVSPACLYPAGILRLPLNAAARVGAVAGASRRRHDRAAPLG
jgi:hypothetical protein